MAKTKRTRQQRQRIVPMAMPASPASTPAAAPAATDKTQAVELMQALEQVRGNRAVVYWASDVAKISDGVVIPLFDVLSAIGKQQTLDLVLFTRGGDTEAPWRIVSLFREFCGKFNILIPYRAHSAGTLIALGADEIVMTPLAELGPIDPSRTHPLLPRREGATEAEPISVQDMRHAMRFIREAATGDGNEAMPYTPEAMAQIFTALFEKIHPLAIGAIEQSYALSKLIGAQALGTHMDAQADGPKIKAIVDRLCDEYKSHLYQINRKEARAIGLKAVDATPDEEKALLDLLKFYVSRHVPPTSLPAVGQTFAAQIAWLESTQTNMRAEVVYKRVDQARNEVVNDQWKPY
jgi:hypothetical protein